MFLFQIFRFFCYYFIILDTGLPKPSNADGNNSVSSDDELFQECENGFDLDATAVMPNVTRAHSSNIDHNVFDKTINFSSITANSTAGLASTSDFSLPSEKSDILFHSVIADQTINGESISSTHGNSTVSSNVVESVLEVPSVESFAKSSEEVIRLVEQPANINIVVDEHIEIATEKADVDQTAEAPSQEESSVSEGVQTNMANNMVPVSETPDISNIEHFTGLQEQNEVQKEESQSVEKPIKTDAVTENAESTTENLDQLVEELSTSEQTTLSENEPVKLDETIDNSPAGKEIGSTTEIDIVRKNPVENLNSTIEITPEPTKNEIQDVQTSMNNSEPVDAVQNEIPLNVTTDLAKEAVETDQPKTEVTPIQLNVTGTITIEDNSTDAVQEVEFSVDNANQTFEAMEVDMNETVDIQQPSVVAENQVGTTNEIVETPFNQTVEMTDLDQADEMAQPPLNITVDVSTVLSEPKPISNESLIVHSQQPKVKSYDNNGMNTTQVLSEDPNTTVSLNQTIDIPSAKLNVTPPSQPNEVNETFVKMGSPTIFNQTHNISKDFLSSTRHFEASNKNVLPKVNLNETVVVDNKLPSVNTSFIVSPKAAEPVPQPNQVNETFVAAPKQNENTFKLPAKPTKTTNPFDTKIQTQNQFDVSDDEFQSPGRKFFLFFVYLFLFFVFPF